MKMFLPTPLSPPPLMQQLSLTPLLLSVIPKMCRKINCPDCTKFTWAGCGMHIANALAGVPEEARCAEWAKTSGCGVKAIAPTCGDAVKVDANSTAQKTTKN